jgi:vitamin B12 transporter
MRCVLAGKPVRTICFREYSMKSSVLRAPARLAAARFVSPVFAFSTLTLACQAAHAQATLPPVVVTAARVEQRVDDTFVAVTVLQRADIEASQAADLVTLLRQQPGVEITQLGGYGTQASAFLRGAEARHTLVLLDGVPLSSLNFSLAPLEHLMLANVERIEIARGNLSSLYGSSALGGVIQIFTTGPGKGLQASASAGVASHDTHSGKAALANRIGGTSFGIDAAGLRTQGYNVTDASLLAGTNPDRDGYRNATLGGFVAQEIGPWGAELRLRRVQGRVEYDSAFGPASQLDESSVRVDTATAMLRHKAETFSNELRIASSEDDLRADVTAFPYFVNSRATTLAWGGQWSVAQSHRLSGGIERVRSRIGSDTLYATEKRTQETVRLGYDGQTGAHQWQANVRHDSYSDFGDATTGLVGYGHQLTSALRASATYATGFAAPTFNDLFYPFGGNAALRPERSINREVALVYDEADLSVRATVFDNSYRDLIANDAFFNRVNIGRARIRGVELAGAFTLAGIRLAPSATYQDPKDETTNTQLPRRARKLFSLSASTEVAGFAIGADLRGSGGRYDRVGNSRPLGRYVTLDLRLRKQLTADWTIQAAVRNVADEDYTTAYGYRQSGRVGSLTLSYAMK